MERIEKSITVNVPVSTAYNQWTQFEEFPKFMSGIEQVRQEGDTHLFWKANIAGKDVEWEAEITEQTPDTKIAWTSTTGAHNAGIVTFRSEGASSTHVTVSLEYEPEGFVENAGSTLGLVGARVEGDLAKFKEFIESRGTETGAWRGEVGRGSAGGGI